MAAAGKGDNEEELVEVERPAPPPPQHDLNLDGDLKAEMTDPDLDNSHSSSSSGLALQRMSANNSHPFMNAPPDDDDEDSSPLHPLMSRLQNRLLSRNTNINRASSNKFDSLHPYTSILSIADVDQCVELENSAFPKHERCSREKVRRRVGSITFDSFLLFGQSGQWSRVYQITQCGENTCHENLCDNRRPSQRPQCSFGPIVLRPYSHLEIRLDGTPCSGYLANSHTVYLSPDSMP